MANITGNNNIVINGSDNTISIMKKVVSMQEKIFDSNAISSIILGQIQTNHELLQGVNPNSIYLAGINKAHIDDLVDDAQNILSCANIGYHFIDASLFTLSQLYKHIANLNNSFYNDLFDGVAKTLYEMEQVFIIKNISKLKNKNRVDVCRELIKILDDAHLKNIHPKADLIFIDSATFLEKNYSIIGNYLSTNILGLKI